MSRTTNHDGRGDPQHDVDFPDLSLACALCWALDRLNISDKQRDRDRDDKRIEEAGETFVPRNPRPIIDGETEKVELNECPSCGCPIEPNKDGYPGCGCQWVPAHMKAKNDDI